MSPRGRFITLEGGEGAGKSTQAARLSDWLQARGHAVVRTREPGGAPGSEAIRDLLVTGEPDRWTPTTEMLLHMAARSEHVSRTIEPALSAGQWVVCDRFFDSTRAYQGAGLGIDPAIIDVLHRLLFRDLRPDLTLLLDLPVEAGLARARSRGGEDRYERFDADFHGRLRRSFLHQAKQEPARFAVIDADRPEDAVAQAIRDAVAERVAP